MTLQDAFAVTVVDEWVRGGVTDAVVAPGSRSTPLAAALAADGRLRVHVVLDERSAAFFALGLGLASGRPAVVLTTSGTAAAELHPAVVEAHQAGVPLLACTADRPPDLHHVGAPQTVEQEGLFAGAVRWAFSPGPVEEVTAGVWRSVAARAVAEATASPAGPGPVHLNLAFREPLAGDADRTVAARAGGGPWHRRAPGRAAPPADVVAALAGGGKGVVVAGAGAGDPEAVAVLAGALGWPVLADPRSGCRVPGAVAAADALLRVDGFAGAHRPEAVLRLGAPWASRVVGEWLAALDVPQWLVDPHGAWLDPGRSATTVVAADPTLLAEAVAAAGPCPAPAGWAEAWAAAEECAQAAFDAVLGDGALSEPAVARAVVDAVPAGGTLFVSSSMPVRDVEWYGRPRTGLRVLANRGANGIDGVVSTALGSGAGVALVGDLAFLHDTNGLLVPAGAGRPLDTTVVVVDNDGGGIFSFLPQAGVLAPDRFERLLGTPHGLDLVAVARAHGVAAERVSSLAGVTAAAGPPAGVRVVVVPVPDRRANVAVHDDLHRAVAAAVSRK
ncbi:MAG TPA: 2-succinyl-5-enolpyruvyl-6-hydroxy-3-cyclohexene-1-carboxylic-acid synthase [Acidimicrobiales bacterium]|nr:2-succinyl-5-enolpyruvyl-6-hydroxy-3-cyclohexene-1-carboxylic-acid synthase [Acidimicrobiales bacterium]